MNNIHNLTVVVVTYKTEEKILTDCLNSIDPRVKILLVENSKNIAFKEKFENIYPNLNVVLSGSNLGLDQATTLVYQELKLNLY